MPLLPPPPLDPRTLTAILTPSALAPEGTPTPLDTIIAQVAVDKASSALTSASLQEAIKRAGLYPFLPRHVGSGSIMMGATPGPCTPISHCHNLCPGPPWSMHYAAVTCEPYL
jgi:hypothetical protein